MRRSYSLFLAVLISAVCCAQAATSTITIGHVGRGASAIEVASQRAAGKWRAAQPDPKANAGGASWCVFTLTGEGAALSASPIRADESGSLVAPLSKRSTAEGLAVRGGSPRQPRHGENVTDARVVEAVTGHLRAKGIHLGKARITQCVKVDLLGDGTPEWLVCAHSRDNIADAGVDRKPDDYALAAIVSTPASGSGLHVDPLKLDVGSAKEAMGQFYRFAGVVDLDGRGALSAALHSVYYEGGGIQLWSFEGRRAHLVTGGGWGL